MTDTELKEAAKAVDAALGVDPGEPGPEPLRAKEIKGHPCILKPITKGHEEEGKDGPYDYMLNECWMLDRAGIERYEPELRVSWRRAVPQLERNIGQYIKCRPAEVEGNAVILVSLTGEVLDVANRVIAELVADNADDDDDGKPF